MKPPRFRKFSLKLLTLYFAIVLLICFARPEPGIYFFTGLGLVIVGELIRLWATGFLLKNKILVKDGPYRYVKNPLYIGTFFIMTGFCIMAKGEYFVNWILLVIGILFFVFYYVPYKKRKESRRLKKLFGKEWEEYQKAVPDYIPRLKPLKGEGMRWSIRSVFINSEHWTVMAIFCGILVLYYNRYIIRFINGLTG